MQNCKAARSTAGAERARGYRLEENVSGRRAAIVEPSVSKEGVNAPEVLGQWQYARPMSRQEAVQEHSE